MPAPPTVGDHIIASLKKGIPLHGTFNPKTDKITWRQGQNKIHGRAVTKLIESGRIKVESMPFPFTNGRRVNLVSTSDAPQLPIRKPVAGSLWVIAMNEYGTKREKFQVIGVRPAKKDELLLDLAEGYIVAAGNNQQKLCVVVRRP